MKKEKENPEELKPDLKHDTMEYAASADGDDVLDMDHESRDEVEAEDISAGELEILEDDGPDNQAFALDSVETDRVADDDVIFDANDVEEEDEEDVDDTEMPRK